MPRASTPGCTSATGRVATSSSDIRHGGTVHVTDNDHHHWSVDLSPVNLSQITEVHVCTEISTTRELQPARLQQRDLPRPTLGPAILSDGAVRAGVDAQ